MTTSPNSPRQNPPAGVPASAVATRAGFSLIEVIIAMLILTIGVLGLATTTAHIVRQITLGDLMTERSVAFQTVIDRLQALPYDDVGSGTDVIGVFELRWASTPDGPQSKIVRIWTRGPGVGGQTFPTHDPVRVDSFDFRVLRR